MPAILDRLVKQLIDNGMSKDKAWAVATKQMQKAGNLKKGTQIATAQGIKRGNMTPAERAKDRAARNKGGSPSDYRYNKHNNSAVKGVINNKVKKRS